MCLAQLRLHRTRDAAASVSAHLSALLGSTDFKAMHSPSLKPPAIAAMMRSTVFSIRLTAAISSFEGSGLFSSSNMPPCSMRSRTACAAALMLDQSFSLPLENSLTMLI